MATVTDDEMEILRREIRSINAQLTEMNANQRQMRAEHQAALRKQQTELHEIRRKYEAELHEARLKHQAELDAIRRERWAEEQREAQERSDRWARRHDRFFWIFLVGGGTVGISLIWALGFTIILSK